MHITVVKQCQYMVQDIRKTMFVINKKSGIYGNVIDFKENRITLEVIAN